MTIRTHKKRGFTLIELTLILAIAGVVISGIASIVHEDNTVSRDRERKEIAQQLLDGLEEYYHVNNRYPDDGQPAAVHEALSLESTGLMTEFFGPDKFVKEAPKEPERFRYCTSEDRKSFALLIDTEDDRELDGKPGTPFCKVVRGPGPSHGCDSWMAVNANDLCAHRFE